MKIIIACERYGIIRDTFIKKGHDAFSCDIEPTEKEGPHIQDDILNHLNDGWDLMIAHPECKYLANSGVWCLHRDPQRWNKMIDAANFFKILLNAPIKKICIENPIQHKYALEIIGRKYSQTIQPWQFGEDASKRTCLWLKNLPNLIPTKIIKKEKYSNQTPSGQNKLGPSVDRSIIRAKTYQGIADAMVEQWTNHLFNNI